MSQRSQLTSLIMQISYIAKRKYPARWGYIHPHMLPLFAPPLIGRRIHGFTGRGACHIHKAISIIDRRNRSVISMFDLPEQPPVYPSNTM